MNELGLVIDYRDGFVAYLNGYEVARVGVTRSSGRNAQGVKVRDERGAVYVALKDIATYLKDGTNVLAIEGHAASADGADFLLDPSLISED